MKRLVFIGNMPAPYMVKMCAALQSHFRASFWFYERLVKGRPRFWKVPLGEHCRVLRGTLCRYRGKYLNLTVASELRRADPDVLLLGGFLIPSNWLAYRWARRRGKRVAVVTEHWRTGAGRERKKGLLTRLIRHLYRHVDAVLAIGEHARRQLVEEFGFPTARVHEARYPADLDAQLRHPLRGTKAAYTFLFPHRLTDIYNPLMALEIFREVRAKHRGSRLSMNAAGELRGECEARIAELGLAGSVSFLDGIRRWSDLPAVYQGADISISPCKYSNGNLSIWEAMASGMGIVLSDRVRVNREAVRESGGGFVCALTVEEFVAAIEQYIRTPDLLRRHGEINKKLAASLSVGPTVELWARLIHEHVLGAETGPGP